MWKNILLSTNPGACGATGVGFPPLTSSPFFFIYFWTHWVFDAAHRLFLVAASGSYSLVAMHRFLIVMASLDVESGSREWGL